ncbi:unnamed protein product [Rotaria sp. Silwood2]|nr:unnamed protein product [Rotaria sp. Silwood2]
MFDNIASLNFIHYDKLSISIEKQQNEQIDKQIHLNNQENSIYATAMISLEKEEMNLLNSVECTHQFDKIIKHNQRSAMKTYVKQLNSQIEEIAIEIRIFLKLNEYNKFEIVLTIDVHTRDTVDILIRDGINKSHDFSWQCQLRVYWISKEDNLFLEQCNGKFYYGYEYMGLNDRLVITLLTDRIYLTVTQALPIFLGCVPGLIDIT